MALGCSAAGQASGLPQRNHPQAFSEWRFPSTAFKLILVSGSLRLRHIIITTTTTTITTITEASFFPVQCLN